MTIDHFLDLTPEESLYELYVQFTYDLFDEILEAIICKKQKEFDKITNLILEQMGYDQVRFIAKRYSKERLIEKEEIEMINPNRAGILTAIDDLDEGEEITMLVMPIMLRDRRKVYSK